MEVTSELPSDRVLEQWLAEPVKMLILPTTLFVTNAKGFPVLSKRHQRLIQQLMWNEPDCVISSMDFNGPFAGSTLLHFREYLNHLYNTKPQGDVIDEFASGYHDYLQAPLQPLMDNLESGTYQVFEKDPIKYRQYEEAVYRALMDRPQDQTYVIMVVGAGRGPLVDRSLRAAERAQRKTKVYAIEKNPNAILTYLILI